MTGNLQFDVVWTGGLWWVESETETTQCVCCVTRNSIMQWWWPEICSSTWSELAGCDGLRVKLKLHSVFAVWLLIPSCSDDDRKFAVRHGLSCDELRVKLKLHSVSAVWLGIPSCSDDDREFAVRHSLDFVDVYDEDQRHILNSDQVCDVTFHRLTASCMHVMNHNWSARKEHLHLLSVAAISWHSA